MARYTLYRRSSVLIAAASLLALTLAACGQVITNPTPQSPTATPTITPTHTVTPRPTVTPAPYTPEPTATPTVAPTPIIHTIRAGETLIALAQQYGVSVAAIQEANGIVDPRLLRVNQVIIIPTDAESLLSAGTATPEPTPMPVEIGDLYFGHDARGGLWALGQAFNPGPEPLEGIRVALTLLDDSGQSLVHGQTLIAAELLEPGQSSPFGVYFKQPPEAFNSYLTQTVSAYPAHVGFYYRDLVVEAVEVENERYFTYHVTGVVRNTGPEQAIEVKVVVSLLDVLGQVIGFRIVEPEHAVIPANGQTTFNAEIIPVGGPAADFTVSAQGHRLRSATPQP